MIVLDPAALAGLADGDLDALATARECVVAIGSGRVSGSAAAALLLSDYAAIEERSTLVIDSAVAWAGVIWRIGSDALRLACGDGAAPAGASRCSELNAADARARRLVDELFHGDWREWLERWLAHRSTAALDSAALLTGRRGGDALERAEFARLFATGEPQHGMEAFLGKRKPRFER